eukprot:5445028-Amphidinium_carterae.1
MASHAMLFSVGQQGAKLIGVDEWLLWPAAPWWHREQLRPRVQLQATSARVCMVPFAASRTRLRRS